MAFDKDYFTQIGVGGKQGQQLWLYYSQEDLSNYATPQSSYAYFDLYGNFPQAASGDIILAFNAASPNVIVYAITVNDENGTSVLCCRGRFGTDIM